MLSYEKTMQLVTQSQNGDEQAKETLVVENVPLIKSVIRRFKTFPIEYDDLYGLALVGFMKAVNNFDISKGVQFSTYVVPMVLGEVKRYLRDDGYIKVSRVIKVLSFKISKYIDDYSKEYEKIPTINQIASHFNVDPQDVILALDSKEIPKSLYEKSDESDSRGGMLIDRLIVKSIDVDERLSLRDAISKLDRREKDLIIMRYKKDLTQSQTAKAFGISQVQVSRLEKSVLKKLKKEMSVK